MDDFLQTVASLLSNDNATRDAAEKRFHQLKDQKPNDTVSALYQVMAERSVAQATREQAVVLFRQCLTKVDDERSIWRGLGEAAQAQMKAQTLELFKTEQVPSVRRKIADVVQSLFNQTVGCVSGGSNGSTNCAEWPEWMPFMLQIVCSKNEDGGLRADALWCVKEVMCTAAWIMVANPTQTTQVLTSCLEDEKPEVRAAAAELLCELVDSCGDKEWKPFAHLCSSVVSVAADLAQNNRTELLNKVLTSMQATPDTAMFFRDCVASHLLPLASTITKSVQLDEASRRLALEVLISIVEARPKMIVKVPGYVEQTLEVCVSLLLMLDDDVQSWSTVDDDEDEAEELFVYAMEVVDRLCKAVQKAEVFDRVQKEVLQKAVTVLFARNEWKSTVAGVTVLGQCAEYLEDEATVIQMVAIVRKYLQDPHPRVRYVAWGAFALFSQDQAEIIRTEEFASQLLPCFVQGFEDQCPRVAVHCMDAFQYYGEEMDRETMEVHAAAMMERLGRLLQNEMRVKKMAITSIAVIAGTIEDSFAPYYPALMPILKGVVGDVLHKPEHRQLLGKAFECISLLAKAVGTEMFRPDSTELMQAMIAATKVPDLPSNDPVKEYMMAAAERICATMKSDFVPFVPHLLPGIFEKLTLCPKEVNSGNAADGLEEGDEINLALVTQNGQVKVMLMNTSEMEDLRHALECVHTFADELKAQYADFIPMTAQALLPVFDFPMGEEVRDLAFETWGHLLTSAKLAGRGQVLQELSQEFLKRILPQMKEKINNGGVNVEALKTRADGVTTCLKKAGPNVLGVEDVKHIIGTITTLLQESFDRRQDLEQEKAKRQAALQRGDEEDDPEEEDEEEEGLRVALNEIAGALMQNHQDIFIAEGLQPYVQLVQKLIQPTAQLEDRKLAIFVVCDMLEHLGEKVVPQWPCFLEHMLNCIAHEKTELRQPACYGASIAAKQQAFAPFASVVAMQLGQVITAARGGKKKQKSDRPVQAAADNAVTALGNILQTHPQSVADKLLPLWSVWVNGLPCQTDEEEGIKNHRTLLSLVQQQKPEVLGEGQQNLPKLLMVLIDVYKTDAADEDTSKGIGSLLQSAGQTQLEKYASQFSNKQKQKLMRILRDAANAPTAPVPQPVQGGGGYAR